MNKFSERMKELRLEKKLLQKELSIIFQTSQSTIARWENGIQEPDFDMLIRIANYFDVTTDYLLGRE